MVGGSKVVGSAQRRRRGAVLQHGGILLARSAYAPALPGIQELSGIMIDVVQLIGAIVNRFSEAAGATLIEGKFTAYEKTDLAELVQTKYATTAWNCKR